MVERGDAVAAVAESAPSSDSESDAGEVARGDAAAEVAESPDSSDSESDAGEDPRTMDPVHPTPLEKDMQLQMAEVLFRSILEGKRLSIDPRDDAEAWSEQYLGKAWVVQNRRQRKEVYRRIQADGEDTPMWTEALANMGEIACEVFDFSSKGEMVRRLKNINRTEVVEQFKELCPKVRVSYYARCGAGNNLHGFRACIAIFHLFMRDSEVLDLCASCVRHCVSEHEANRDVFAELSVPLTPAAMDEDCVDRGWSFLRHALDAFMVQVGETPVGGFVVEAPEAEIEGEAVPAGSAPEFAPSRAVALRIATALVGIRGAPAIQVQLLLLREPLPDGACTERRELKELVPRASQKVSELLAEEPSETLEALGDMLRWACGDEDAKALPPGDGAEGEGPAPTGSGDGVDLGIVSGLAAGVRELLGR